MPRPKLHDAHLRQRLLERTAQMVADGGVGALSLRNLAAAESTSTTAVYSLFGGKPALLAALHGRGFELFAEAQSAGLAMAGREPVDGLRALGRAYWTWALANPHLYLVMFDPSLHEFIGDHQQVTDRATVGAIRDLVNRSIDAGDLRGDAETISFHLWSSLHGAITLLLSGFGPTEERARTALLEHVLQAGLRAWSD